MTARAYRLDDLVKIGPFGRTTLFELVKGGKLPARKIQGRVFVLESDWLRFLEAAPLATDVRKNARSLAA